MAEMKLYLKTHPQHSHELYIQADKPEFEINFVWKQNQ
jgi:hypothetical protein